MGLVKAQKRVQKRFCQWRDSNPRTQSVAELKSAALDLSATLTTISKQLFMSYSITRFPRHLDFGLGSYRQISASNKITNLISSVG